MIFQITVPAQKTAVEDINIDDELAIIAKVTGFWVCTAKDASPTLRWGLNPNGLFFSSFPESFTSLCLSKHPLSNEFRLTAEYEYIDTDDGELIKESVVFKVSSVEEVQSFPSITS